MTAGDSGRGGAKDNASPVVVQGVAGLGAVTKDLLRDRMVWLVLLTAALLRMALWTVVMEHPERRYWDDSHDYAAIAHTVATAGEYSRQPNGPPDLFRAPGYPAFLVPFVATLDEPGNWIALVQIVIDLATVLLIMMLCSRHLTRTQMLVAGTLYAFALVAINMSNLVLSETIYNFIMICLLLVVDRMWHLDGRRRVWLSGVAGLLLGISVLIRMVSLPLVALLAARVAWKGPARERVCSLMLCLTGFVMPVGGWLARNHHAGAGWCLSTNGDQMLLQCDAAPFLAHISGRPSSDARVIWHELRQEAEARARARGDASQAAVARTYREMAIEILGRHPVKATLFLLKYDLRNLLPDHINLLVLVGLSGQSRGGVGSTLKREGLEAALYQWFGLKAPSRSGLILALALTVPFALLLAACYLLAAMGCMAVLRRRDFVFLLVLLLPAVYMLAVPGGGSSPRYGAPAMPFICILAACSPWPWRRKTQASAANAVGSSAQDGATQQAP